MTEFLAACVHLVNLPYTVLLVVISLYWLTVILGVFDFDLLPDSVDPGLELPDGADVDISGALEANVDLDLDVAGADATDALSAGEAADAAGSSVAGLPGPGGGSGFLSAFGKLLGIGAIPITILFSFMILFAWMVSLLANHYMGGYNVPFALLLAIPNLLGSLLAARIVAHPFGMLFRALHKDQKSHERLEGKICIIRTSRADTAFGQAEIQTDGAPHLLSVRTREGTVLQQGDQALIIMHDRERDIYIVQPYFSSERLLSKDS
jgi:hypothetical protein